MSCHKNLDWFEEIMPPSLVAHFAHPRLFTAYVIAASLHLSSGQGGRVYTSSHLVAALDNFWLVTVGNSGFATISACSHEHPSRQAFRIFQVAFRLHYPGRLWFWILPCQAESQALHREESLKSPPGKDAPADQLPRRSWYIKHVLSSPLPTREPSTLGYTAHFGTCRDTLGY